MNGHQEGKGWGGMNWDWDMHTIDTMYEIGNEWVPTAHKTQCPVVTQGMYVYV